MCQYANVINVPIGCAVAIYRTAWHIDHIGILAHYSPAHYSFRKSTNISCEIRMNIYFFYNKSFRLSGDFIPLHAN